MATVVVMGTLDTKGEEHQFLAQQIRNLGVDVITVDTGVQAEALFEADVTRDVVAVTAGTSVAELVKKGDRSSAVETMGRGAGVVLKGLLSQGRLDAVVTLGGGGGTTIASIAMNALPVGVPKLIVSTIASGDTRPIVKGTDITLMYSVLDIAGLNSISRRIITNAAGAAAGMAGVQSTPAGQKTDDSRPIIGATMFGVTTSAVTAARARLEAEGYEVLVFHATGSGGESMESLIRAGYISGVLDLTTTELVDDLVGGVMSAGPERLTAAALAGIPQVVSVGALDMVNLGPLELIAPDFRQRNLIQHAPTMTLMRTTVDENVELGKRIAAKLNASAAPARLYLPLKGVSSIATAGGPFYDAEADAALFSTLRTELKPGVEIVELDLGADDAAFGEAMADGLLQLLNTTENGDSE